MFDCEGSTLETRVLELESSAEYASPICCKLKKINIAKETITGAGSVPIEALSYK